MSLSARNKYARRTREAAIFGMFGAMMFASKYLMEILPNIHLLATFIGILTVVYRWRALIPIYIYVLLDGLFHGFSLWWIAYLYIFLPLFFGFLLLPRHMPDWGKAILYPVIAALHGFLFGIPYALRWKESIILTSFRSAVAASYARLTGWESGRFQIGKVSNLAYPAWIPRLLS